MSNPCHKNYYKSHIHSLTWIKRKPFRGPRNRRTILHTINQNKSPYQLTENHVSHRNNNNKTAPRPNDRRRDGTPANTSTPHRKVEQQATAALKPLLAPIPEVDKPRVRVRGKRTDRTRRVVRPNRTRSPDWVCEPAEPTHGVGFENGRACAGPWRFWGRRKSATILAHAHAHPACFQIAAPHSVKSTGSVVGEVSLAFINGAKCGNSN